MNLLLIARKFLSVVNKKIKLFLYGTQSISAKSCASKEAIWSQIPSLKTCCNSHKKLK